MTNCQDSLKTFKFCKKFGVNQETTFLGSESNETLSQLEDDDDEGKDH